MATLLNFPASAMIPDTDAQLVAGDNPAVWANHEGRLVLRFDDTDEAAALTPPVEMPNQYTGSGLSATLHTYAASATSSNFRFDVYVEAVTDGDTLDLETATGWNSANSASIALGGTAGDLHTQDITLSNDDGVVAGDMVRFGIRRDCDHADDVASGHAFLAILCIEDDG